ncbi:MAG: transcriptional repressor [Gammaproteobacteria bacterium]
MTLLKENNISPDKIPDLLLEHAINPTAQRVEIAKVLLARQQHMSAGQVLARVNKRKAVASKATVYNTLKLFAEKGLVRQLIIESDKVFYDSNTALHHHFYNEDTGMLQDIDADKMVITNLPKLPEGTVNSGVDVIIRVKHKA